MPQFSDQAILPQAFRVDNHDECYVGLIKRSWHQDENVRVAIPICVDPLRRLGTEGRPARARAPAREPNTITEAAEYRRIAWDAHAEVSDGLSEVVDPAHEATVSESRHPSDGKTGDLARERRPPALVRPQSGQGSQPRTNDPQEGEGPGSTDPGPSSSPVDGATHPWGLIREG
ncbi:hypothetical protein MLI01_08690 [Microbacterium maritypicum]|uniref:Uncharacterized protein n=1 Tax=Microbacterium maritypicum TaxID=33918 RepID=A0A4Y4B6X2_MICMQ|nr:hypothetical protein MLI01_08690 [Microbacterium liquefaciens]